MFAFAIQVARGRWLMLYASFLIMAGAGTVYAFGIYSRGIKTALGYDQKTLNLIGFSKDLGQTFGVVAGLISEVTPTWCVLLIGAAMNFVGYFMMWLSVTGRISKPHVWQMCTYILVGSSSQNFANTGVLVTGLRNFPESRGIMVGLLKGYTGLSGAVITQLYHALYGDNSTSLILLIAWLPAVVSVLFFHLIREKKYVRQENEKKVFYSFLYISIALALLLMAISIIQKQKTFSHAGYVVGATVVCILLFLPLGLIIKEEFVIWNLTTKQESRSPQIKVQSLPLEPLTNTSSIQSPIVGKSHKDSWFSNTFKPPNYGEDYTIPQGVVSVDMLLLFIAGFSGCGTTLTAIDNLGQIGESLGFPTLTISTFVSLVSIWNYFGRVGAGFISESLLSKWGFPRTLVMTATLFLSCIGHILIAFPFPGSLYVASVIIGFSYGAQLTLIYTIISELFGLKHYSTLFNCGVLSSPLGSYVFNVKVAGTLYDIEAMKQLKDMGLTRDSVKELTCIGKQCYRESFIVLAGVSFAGALVSLVLVLRTKKFYKCGIYKKFREDEEAMDVEIDMSGAKSPGQKNLTSLKPSSLLPVRSTNTSDQQTSMITATS